MSEGRGVRGVAGSVAPVCRQWLAPSAGAGAREGVGANRQHPVNPHRTMSPRSLRRTLTLTSEVVAEKVALLTASLLRQRL